MAGIVGAAVANESVSKIFSILSGDPGPGEDETPEDRAERLQLAVLKIHGVVAVSDDWQIVHLPLLNWKAKLRSVAMEGDVILHRASTSRRRRSATEQRRQQEESATARRRRRRIQAAKRFMPFAFSRAAGEEGHDDPSEATVRRFERLASSADEFFRYVQSGGRRRPENLLVSFRVPAGLLPAGETIEISIRNGSQDALLLIHRHGEGGAGRRDEVALFLSNDDDDATRWEKNVKLSVVFRLSDHIDDIGMVVSSSLELLPPQFSALRVTMMELVGQVLAKGTSCYSHRPSAMSVWFGGTMAWRCRALLTEEKGSGDGSRLQLPSPIVKVNALCFASPLNDSSNTADGGLPFRLMCHISPQLVPGMCSEKYDQIEPQTLRELLPAEGAAACRGDWWCPRSSTFLSMKPELSASPPSLRQLYVMDQNPERPAGVDVVVAEDDEEI